MRWTSIFSLVAFRRDLTTGGPSVIFGTKWPSITSTWIMRAPPRSTRATSSARWAKSAARIEGSISTICGLSRFYHSGEKPIARLAPGDPVECFGDRIRRYYVFIFFVFERAGGVDQTTSGRERGKGLGQQGGLALVERRDVGLFQSPLNLRIARQRAGSRTRGIHQNAVEGAGEGQGTRAVEHHQLDRQSRKC